MGWTKQADRRARDGGARLRGRGATGLPAAGPGAPSRADGSGARGFTLLELVIAIGIVAAIALIVVPSAESAMGVRTREAASKLAGTVRAMYDEAALSGSTCRLVFDLDEGSYWPECAKGRVRVTAREESVRGRRVEEDPRDRSLTEEEEQARREIESRRSFNASSAFAKRSLPDGVDFVSVWTQHQPEPYTEGQAYLYFFPSGQTERAYLHLARGDDAYTIVVQPVTGRAKVHPEHIPVPDKELRPW